MEPSKDEIFVDGLSAPEAPSRFDRASYLASKLKTGAKQLLDIHDKDTTTDADGGCDLFEDAAFNPEQVLEADPHERGSLRDKLRRGPQAIAHTLKNPKRALRSNYVRNVAGNVSGQPTAYHKQYDEELVQAHDALARAHAHAPSTADGSVQTKEYNSQSISENHKDHVITNNKGNDVKHHHVESAKARIQEVEAQRDSLRAAWILGRHVRRVRVARPIPHYPRKSDFVRKSNHGYGQRTQWHKYLAQQALWHTRSFTPYFIDDFDEPPFDFKDLSMTVERFAVVSAPWQNFSADVRELYLWRDPKRTFKFFIVYWILWYFQYIVPAALACLVVATIKNKFRPTRVDTIRKRVQRASDDQARAQAWGELIQRHGKHDWIEPFIDEAGPIIQLQLGDIADLMERAESFYRWERPRQTMLTLCLLIVALMTIIWTSMEFCVRLVWLGAGIYFFIFLPLTSNYPRYRKLFNPLIWLFWDTPTVAELAIVQLQEKSAMKDTARLNKLKTEDDSREEPQFSDSSSEDNDVNGIANDTTDADLLSAIRDEDQVTFRAVNAETHAHGRLRILRDGFWYYDKVFKIFCPYSRLVEMRKVDISRANNPDASIMARVMRRVEESTSLQFLPSGIEFIFLPQSDLREGPSPAPTDTQQPRAQPSNEQLALTVSESDRARIFNLIIGWSNLRWQPHFTLNKRNRLATEADDMKSRVKRDEDLDKAVKSFIE